MLRPMIEAAGYRVVSDAEDDEADLVIASLGEELPATPRARRSGCAREPEPASKKDDSIYRYDRAGLADGAEVGSAGGANERASAGRDDRGRARGVSGGGRESVVELETLIPVPRAAPHIAGLSALRSRVLTVDGLHALARAWRHRLLRRHSRGSRRRARRSPLRPHRRSRRRRGRSAVRAAACPRRHGAGWERVSQGMVETENGPLLLIDVAALIAGAEAKAAA